MTSPDFRQYIDLTLYDVDPFQLYDDAITYAQTSVPEFQPRIGTLEEAIMQAIVYNTAQLIASINRLPDGLMEGLALLTGLTRNEATFATGEVEITVYVSTGDTIPAGTVFTYQTVNDDILTSYNFYTTTDLIIPNGNTSGTVAIQGIVAGQYPALLDGQEFELVSPAPKVTSIVLSGDLSIGSNAETDTEYLNRAAQHFASLSSCLTTKSQMANYISSNYANIPYSAVFDLTDSGDLLFGAADAPGYVTVVAISPTGGNVSAGDKTDLQTDLESKSVAGLVIDIVDAEFVPITIDLEFALLNGYNSLTVQNAVETRLTELMSYKGYDFRGEIVQNELVSQLSQVAGVKYVSNITFTESSGFVSFASGVLTFTHKNCVPDPTVNITVI